MLSDTEIKKWYEIALTTNENSIVEYDFRHTEPNGKHLKRFILEMKIQIDRWDAVIDNLIFNSLVKDYVINSLGKDLNEKNGQYSLWGCDLVFTDCIPVDRVLGTDSSNNAGYTGINGRNVVIGSIPLDSIERLQKLKAFW